MRLFRCLILLIFMGWNLNLVAQENGNSLKYELTIPTSVYASYLNAPLDSLSQIFPEFPTLNSTLNFLRFNKIDMERGLMVVPFQNMKDLSMYHFYDTYQELHIKSYMQRSFVKPFDSWNFNFEQYKAQFRKDN